MSSKLLSSEGDFFADMAVTAMSRVKTTNASGELRYPVKAVHILKNHGKSSKESLLIDGYALEQGRSGQGMPMFIKNAKIACIDFNLNKFRLQMGV